MLTHERGGSTLWLGEPMAIPALPRGTVTFFYTDLEGSTRQWEQQPAAMRAAVDRHMTLLRRAIQAHLGHVFRTTGDGLCAAFTTAPDALSAAVEAQRAVQGEPWGKTGPLRVRMALHTGAVEVQDGDYVGACLNRLGRVLGIANGGQIVLSQATADLVQDALPDGVGLRDLGEHRLRDLARAERVFQVLHPDLVADFPSLRSLDALRHNLPPQLTSFVGREREMATIKALLGKHRLVTLTGPGGTGKTRLALQVAADVLHEFPDGVWLVLLAPLTDPALVAAAVAQALGVRDVGGRSPVDSLKGHLQHKHLLLVLDNFEHVLAAAPVVAELLVAGAHLRVLVTSRAALHLTGEHEYPVPPLHTPDPGRLPVLQRLTQYEAVALFVQRAVAVQPHFAVTEANAPAVAEICTRLDGLPLAIELAAARVKLLPPEQLLARLSNRLRVLTGGARDLPARQQTLRATIEWSYRLLPHEAQVLFARLAVFVGGWTLAAAQAVCGPTGDLSLDVLDGLGSLVDQSLLHQIEADDEPRFRMLETIREYATERLEASGEAAVIKQRHLEYYLSLAEEAEPRVHRAEQLVWLHRLDLERANFRAALAWSATSPADVEGGLRLHRALHWFWKLRRYGGDRRAPLTALLACAATSGAVSATVRAKALAVAAELAIEVGDHRAGAQLGEEAVRVARASGDPLAVAWALESRAYGETWHGYRLGDRRQAEVWWGDALGLFRNTGERWGAALTLAGLGRMATQGADFARAAEHLEEALALFREQGDRWGTSVALAWFGRIAERREQWDKAEACFREHLALAQQLGSKSHMAVALEHLGGIARHRGEVAQAIQYFEEALALHRDWGDRSSAAWPAYELARLWARYRQDYARAAALLDESLRMWRNPNDRAGRSGMICGLLGCAELAALQGVVARAGRLLGAAEAGLAASRGVLDPLYQATTESEAEALRQRLGEQARMPTWVAAEEEGRTMTLEQAIAYALDDAPEGVEQTLTPA